MLCSLFDLAFDRYFFEEKALELTTNYRQKSFLFLRKMLLSISSLLGVGLEVLKTSRVGLSTCSKVGKQSASKMFSIFAKNVMKAHMP